MVTIPVQVNGKLRGQIEVKESISKNKVKLIQLAKKDQKVKKYISGKEIVKEVFIPSRLVNLVVRQ